MLHIRKVVSAVGFALLGTCSVACGQPPVASPPTQATTAASAATASSASIASPSNTTILDPDKIFDWSAYKGRCVTLEGYASEQKIGPLLEGGARSVGLVFTDAKGEALWSALPPGGRVEVSGVVAEHADLPVFVPKPGAPMMQGIPVPAGTDLDKARRRYVLEGAWAKLERPVSAVEAELTSKIGQDVKLGGVVWSLNGHWWFNHDGVTLHVAGTEAIPHFQEMHGRAATLTGRLQRRSLPRLDQIVLKPNPDLQDAFLIEVREMTPMADLHFAECAHQ